MAPPFSYDQYGEIQHLVSDKGQGAIFAFHTELLKKGAPYMLARFEKARRGRPRYNYPPYDSYDSDDSMDSHDSECVSASTAHVDINEIVLKHFEHWLYNGNVETPWEEFTSVKNVLQVIDQNEKDSSLRSTGFHDALMDKAIKMMTHTTSPMTVDEIVDILDTSNYYYYCSRTFGKFFADWLVHFQAGDPGIYIKICEVLRDYSFRLVEGMLGIAFLEAKAQGDGVAPPWEKDLCKYHKHEEDEECYRIEALKDVSCHHCGR